MIEWCEPTRRQLKPEVLLRHELDVYDLILSEDAFELMGSPRGLSVGKTAQLELLLKPNRKGFYVLQQAQFFLLPPPVKSGSSHWFVGHQVLETKGATGLSGFLSRAGFPPGIYDLCYDPVYKCYVARLAAHLLLPEPCESRLQV